MTQAASGRGASGSEPEAELSASRPLSGSGCRHWPGQPPGCQVARWLELALAMSRPFDPPRRPRARGRPRAGGALERCCCPSAGLGRDTARTPLGQGDTNISVKGQPGEGGPTHHGTRRLAGWHAGWRKRRGPCAHPRVGGGPGRLLRLSFRPEDCQWRSSWPPLR